MGLRTPIAIMIKTTQIPPDIIDLNQHKLTSEPFAQVWLDQKTVHEEN